MTYRSTQQRGRLLECGDARQRLNLHVRTTFTFHLIDKRRHSVEPCIAGRDDHDGLALFCQQERLFSTFALLLHACVDALTSSLHIHVDELEIVLVAHNGISLPYCFQYGRSDVFFTARSYACYNDFLHKSANDFIQVSIACDDVLVPEYRGGYSFAFSVIDLRHALGQFPLELCVVELMPPIFLPAELKTTVA